jgi:hypothetical protein
MFNKLLSFIKVQLVVTAAALPILVSWGLPISLMSIVGNFLFTPFLTVFLITSSLIFVTEVLCIPNDLLVSTLTFVISLWEKFLFYGKKSWLMGFAQPKKLLASLLVLLAILIAIRFIFNILSKIVFVTIFITIALIIFHGGRNFIYHTNTITEKFVPHTKNRLLVRQLPDKSLQIIDRGFLSRKASPEKFVNFELKPYLIKTYGLNKIDKIVLKKKTRRTARVIKELKKTFDIRAPLENNLICCKTDG